MTKPNIDAGIKQIEDFLTHFLGRIFNWREREKEQNKGLELLLKVGTTKTQGRSVPPYPGTPEILDQIIKRSLQYNKMLKGSKTGVKFEAGEKVGHTSKPRR